MGFFTSVWEGIKWFFTYWSTQKLEMQKTDTETKRIDFGAVTEGYQKLQSVLQERIDDLTKELRDGRAARAEYEEKERLLRLEQSTREDEREKTYRRRIDNISRQLNDCREKELTNKAYMESLRAELKDAREEIATLKTRMDDYDSGEHKKV